MCRMWGSDPGQSLGLASLRCGTAPRATLACWQPSMCCSTSRHPPGRPMLMQRKPRATHRSLNLCATGRVVTYSYLRTGRTKSLLVKSTQEATKYVKVVKRPNITTFLSKKTTTHLLYHASQPHMHNTRGLTLARKFVLCHVRLRDRSSVAQPTRPEEE